MCGRKTFENALPFGTAQQPQLWDHADGVTRFLFTEPNNC